MEDLLKKLWETYKDRLFAPHTIGRDFFLNPVEQQTVIHQINELENQPPKNGLRIKSVGSGIFKVIRTEPNEGDSGKGKPLIGQNEAITGERGEGFPEQSRENVQNHADSTDAPFPAVPAELKARTQWVVWREETRDSKPTKVPYQATGKHAQANQANTWTDYQKAIDHRDQFSGIGFVFSADDPYCGIDLDDCLDDNSQVKAWNEYRYS